MARSRTRRPRDGAPPPTDPTLFDDLEGSVPSRSLAEELEQSFLEYSMSVIVARALPDVRDGLKPVQRRILWSMHQAGIRPDRPFVKCARVVGDVMGRYHPHGDQSIYDALVRMGQRFSLRLPLIDPHGNFGSPSDPPAAMRYTECRLSEAAMRMLEGIDEDTVDLVDNFDASASEPVVLPSRFPNLLVNGSQGIAVGMATNIPPHHLGEVTDAAMWLLEHPEATVEELMRFVSGPDFPTGGLIMGTDGITDAYRTGRGTIRIRARTTVETHRRSSAIVVTEIPFQTSVDQIADKAAELVEAGTIPGIRDIRNESAEGATRLVFELRPGADPEVVLNNLFKHTPMQTTFGANLVALVDGVPRTLTLRDLLARWLEHTEEVIRRRTTHRLHKARERLHIVEGLLRALDAIDAIIATIRSSADRREASQRLQADPFGFSEVQATHILDMPLARLTRLGRTDLEAEAAELAERIASYEEILSDRNVLAGVIASELTELRDTFADERRTTIVADDTGDIDTEALVVDEPLVVTVTARGYVKATPARGRGAKVARPGDKDTLADVIETSTLGHLLVFTDVGKAYKLKGHDIPTDRLTALPNLFAFEPDERPVAVIPGVDDDPDGDAPPPGADVVFVTAGGTVKRTPVTEFAQAAGRRDGLVAVRLPDGDSVTAVTLGTDDDELLVVTRSGQGIRFGLSEVRPMGRNAAGVRAIRLKGDDRVVGACVVSDDLDAVVIATTTGYAKRTRPDELPGQRRGGAGVRVAKLNVNQGQLCGVLGARDRSGRVTFVLDDGTGITVSVTDIPIRNRDSGGGRVVEIPEPATGVVTVLRTPDTDA